MKTFTSLAMTNALQYNHSVKARILVRFISEGKQTELRGKALKGGHTVWNMKSGTPKPIQVTSLDKAVKECLKSRPSTRSRQRRQGAACNPHWLLSVMLRN